MIINSFQSNLSSSTHCEHLSDDVSSSAVEIGVQLIYRNILIAKFNKGGKR